jgi:UDP-N-acetylmuramate dehydrogenase
MPAVRPDVSVELAAELLGPLAERDVPIGPMTTYRVGGAADLFVRLTERGQLPTVAAALRACGLPLLVIGRGSNLLVADAGFRGIALSIAEICNDIDIDVENAQVTAGSGVLLPVLARRTAAAGLTGFEWAVGVPGSVGGAVRMNAGGHGSDMSAALTSVTVADLTGDPHGDIVQSMDADQLGLRFRGSGLTPTQLVIDATLQLAPGDRSAAESELSEIVQWRRANQPGGQNAGSVFVNPVPGEVTCGALIDGAGLRGFRLGSAVVSDKHANFIQADEGGSADDVRALMRVVRDRVEAASGWRLRSEIRLVGFEDDF